MILKLLPLVLLSTYSHGADTSPKESESSLTTTSPSAEQVRPESSTGSTEEEIQWSLAAKYAQ